MQFEMRFTKGETTVTPDKLWFLQKAHAARRAARGGSELQEMVARCAEELQCSEFEDWNFRGAVSTEEYLSSIVRLDAKNYLTPTDFLRRNDYFFRDPIHAHEAGAKGSLNTDEAQTLRWSLEGIEPTSWARDSIKDLLKEQGTNYGHQSQKEGSKRLYHYLRYAIAGGRPGPAIADVMIVIGREESLKRLRQAEDVVMGEELDVERGPGERL